MLGSHLAPGLPCHGAVLLLLLSGRNNFSLEPCKSFLKILIYCVCGQQVSKAGFFPLQKSHSLFCDGLDLFTCFVVLFFVRYSTISPGLEICVISLWCPGFPAEHLLWMGVRPSVLWHHGCLHDRLHTLASSAAISC